jgi:hypothetical protein
MGKACKHECETRNSYKIWLENFEGKFQIEDKLMCHSLTPSFLSSLTHSLSLHHSLSHTLPHFLTHSLTVSEANTCSATREIHNILWNLKFHCYVQWSPPLIHALNQMNLVHTFSCCFLKIHFNIMLSSTSWASQWSLSFTFFYSILSELPLSPIYAACHAHIILCDLVILIIFGEEYRLQDSSLHIRIWY